MQSERGGGRGRGRGIEAYGGKGDVVVTKW